MENLLAKLARNTGPARFFIPVGIILIIFGALMLAWTPKNLVETTGTVATIDRYEDTDGSTVYDLSVDYTVDGKDYIASWSGDFGEYKEGDTIPVFYDEENPSDSTNSGDAGIIAPVMIAAGVAAAGYGVYATVKAFKKQEELDNQIKEAIGSDELPEIVAPDKSELTEYYVAFDGHSLTPGYIVDDEDRDLVFEAPMTKQALIGPRTFTFTNHRTGEVKEHQVGHTTTQTYNNGWFTTRSWFTFDGKNIWDCLHEQGVRIETDLASIAPRVRYTVSINGRFAATIESSSQYVHEEDEAQHKIAIPFGRYYYRVWTNEPDFELIFLTVFAISETEQAVVE